jgi:phosphoribosylformylglycinamidine synthase subunit PurSL
MAVRIDVRKTVSDSRADLALARFKNLGLSKKPSRVWIVDSYVLDAQLASPDIKKISAALMNPVAEEAIVGGARPSGNFLFAIEIGYLPGVTDNAGNTCREMIEDLLGKKFKQGETVYTSKTYFVDLISRHDASLIAESLYNPLIQRARILSDEEFTKEGGFGANVPKVKLPPAEETLLIDLEVSDEELAAIGKEGIKDSDGTRRGPLALDLSYMKAIRDHFRRLKRKPTDIEIETLAQTWSEHCKHTILSSPLDAIKNGLFTTYIKGATETVRKKKGKNDFCVSVFKDNSGAIVFDDTYLVSHKVETHNSPSALDPFGGAITGIVGVNRDALGFGLGAKPIANTYGFCLADPRDTRELWRDKAKTQKMLSARRIMDGVIEGVRAGGNQSGIPTPHGFLSFDPRYRGKPLVFVGTLGLIPRENNGKKLYEKKALSGDYIVMLGGRVGQDGIHGATFSSEAIDAGSPATAVQIGDPITQKKFSDALIREARDLELYNSVTDDGAGGLSSSIGEMAKESGGCDVDLDAVPLKYPGLVPWQTWISESQERMTLAVPPRKWAQFSSLMRKRGVEATRIGTFTKTGQCIVRSGGKKIVDLLLRFLHDGLPVRRLNSKKTIQLSAPQVPQSKDVQQDILELIARPSLASRSFIADQYDHEVQASSVLKPLQGRGRVDGDAALVRPVLSSPKGVLIADGLYPTYSDIDTYAMAAASIDSAIRAVIAAGGRLDRIALLDNFCWCSSFDENRLYELKQAAKACYDAAVSYQAPFISGKDSMFNDFKGHDANGPVKISVPPTLLATAIAVTDDSTQALTIDLKQPGDFVYVLGETNAELGASEYAQMCAERESAYYGGDVPHVSFEKNKNLYEAFSRAHDLHFFASAVSVGRGGLATAFARTAMAGLLGLRVDMAELPGVAKSLSEKLFSESQGRIVVSVAAQKAAAFENVMAGVACKRIGEVTKEQSITIVDGNKKIAMPLKKISTAYRATFKDF